MSFDYIPQALQDVKQWLVWRTKNSPTSAITGKRKDWNKNLSDFKTAVAFCEKKRGYRLGFAFVPDSDIFGIDLDSCRDPDKGEIEDWADEVLEKFSTYSEISVSETGLKLIGIGIGEHFVQKFPDEKQFGDHEPHFEFFSDSKYFALTSDVLEGFDKVRKCQDSIDWLFKKYSEEEPAPEPEKKTGSMIFSVPKPSTMTKVPGGSMRDNIREFNRTNSITDILLNEGYTLDSSSRLVRPGKDPASGHSATLDSEGDCERVTFWSSNCEPFKQSVAGNKAKTYDAWSCHVYLEHAGDFSRAAKAEFHNGSAMVPETVPKVLREEIEPDSVLPYKPFPTGSLPDCAEAFVGDVSKLIDCDEASVALPLLAAMSAAIGNVARLELNYSYVVPSVLWTCIVAKSGTGKTPPWKQVRNLFAPFDEAWQAEYKKAKSDFDTAEKVHKKEFGKWNPDGNKPIPIPPVRPLEKRIITTDITIEKLGQLHSDNPRGLFVCVDELAGFLSSFDRYSSGGEINRWLQLHDGSELVQDRKVAESSYVPKTSISITGTIQPARLFSTIGADGFAAGLAGRFAMACPPPRIRTLNLNEKKQPTFEIESVIKKLMFKPLAYDENEVVVPATIRMSQSAREAFKGYSDEKQHLVFFEDGPITSALPKIVDMVLRISLSFHLFKDPENGLNEPISLATTLEAIEVGEFFTHEAKRLYLGAESGLSKLCLTVLEVLTAKKPERLSVRDLKTKSRALKKAGSDAVGQACNQLKTLGRVESDTEGTRKPKIVFFVPGERKIEYRF